MSHDLFSWRPNEVQILVFPTRNRVGLIRKTAGNVFNSRTDREAEAFWRRSVDGLRRQMEKFGIDEKTIEAELSTFHDCVQGEMQRMAWAERYQPGGDAA